MKLIHQNLKILEQLHWHNMIKVEGYGNLFRDEDSGAIMNLDHSGYQEYVKKRSLKKKEKEEVQNLRSEIEEIKSMLHQILNDRK